MVFIISITSIALMQPALNDSALTAGHPVILRPSAI
jgi:hypothetical protein